MRISKEEEHKRLAKMQENENRLRAEGFSLICGVDEAGRGPLAGPVCAAAVILPDDVYIEGLNDSKKLSEKRREELYEKITETALAYNIEMVDEKTIDEINILQATYLAMNRAVDGLKTKPDYVLIDGNRIEGIKLPHETVVKGDAKSISIAAASILAKVTRDRYICEIADEYPEYNFKKHKGYGTKEHTEAILKHGPCPIHRLTFLKKLLG